MIRLLHFIVLLFACYSVLGQEYTLQPIPSFVEGPAVQQPLHAFAEITNHTYDSKVVVWERLAEDIPLGWDSGVCTSLGCFLSDVTEGEFSILPLESLNVDLQFNTNGIPGYGRVEVKMYFEGDSTNFVVGVYEADATTVNNTNPLFEKVLKVYPNPCSDFCTISPSKNVSSYEIYSVLGVFVKEDLLFDHSQIIVGDLAPGIYFVSLLSAEKKVLHTMPIVVNTR